MRVLESKEEKGLKVNVLSSIRTRIVALLIGTIVMVSALFLIAIIPATKEELSGVNRNYMNDVVNAYGEMLDLQDSIEYLNRNVKVKTGEYSDCGDVDIIVITAGAPPKQGQTRLDTLELSAKICKSIIDPIMASGFDGIFLVISNPVDIITHYVKIL